MLLLWTHRGTSNCNMYHNQLFRMFICFVVMWQDIHHLNFWDYSKQTITQVVTVAVLRRYHLHFRFIDTTLLVSAAKTLPQTTDLDENSQTLPSITGSMQVTVGWSVTIGHVPQPSEWRWYWMLSQFSTAGLHLKVMWVELKSDTYISRGDG